MKLLVDTNIILEVLLERDRQEEAISLLDQALSLDVHLSDFSLHSIGLHLISRNRTALFLQFLEDMIQNELLTIITIPPDELGAVAATCSQFNLDFDDAYQYTLAEKYGLTIISFDKDFDRTRLGRKTPAEILAEKE